MCMKGTWVHVYAVWVSQIHDLCTDFDNFHIILIIFYVIFTLLRGEVKGSDSCHNTWFTDEKDLNHVQGSFMMYPSATDWEDMFTGPTLKS